LCFICENLRLGISNFNWVSPCFTAGPVGVLVPPVPGAAGAGIRPLFGADNRARSQQDWFGSNANNENPFLNPNPINPFAGGSNPFIQSNLSDNPFEIGSSRSDANPFAQQTLAFGGGRHQSRWSRDGDNAWGSGGRGGNEVESSESKIL